MSVESIMTDQSAMQRFGERTIFLNSNPASDQNIEHKPVGFIGGKFLPLHLGHVYAIIAASGYVDKLYVVPSYSRTRDRELCEKAGIEYIPAEVRLSWLGELLNNLENVKILPVEDDWSDENYDWEQGAKMIQQVIGKPIDYIFSSEAAYSKHFDKYYPDSTKHVVLDNSRTTVNISATELRNNLYGHWDKLPTCVRSYFTKKVVLVGTESCGKSTLVKKLAKFYNTNFVQEVGRDYCEKYSDKLTSDMFDRIGMEHFLLQSKKIEESNKVLLVDTDAVVTQYYLDMYFNGKKSALLEEIIRLQDYDLVLYLEPDVAWVDDGLRSSGEEVVRKKNNELLKQMYHDRGIEFVTISGSYTDRFMKAKQQIDRLFEHNSMSELM